jgi:hypothetical protein
VKLLLQGIVLRVARTNVMAGGLVQMTVLMEALAT